MSHRMEFKPGGEHNLYHSTPASVQHHLNGMCGLLQGTFERRTHTVISKLQLVAKCLGLLSFLAFLHQGDCPGLFYRLSGLRMAVRLQSY